MKNCFVIVNYNDYKSTKHLIDNIIDYKIIDHIVIVDSNSRAEEKELLKTIKNKKIEILWQDENLGYSHAINIGSKYLIEKYENVNLIISNSDILIMSEEDIERLIELLNYESIGIVGPQIIERGVILKGYKDISINTEILANIPLLNLFVSDKKCLYPESHYEGNMSIVEVINSAFFLISGEVMKKIGYMDENVFLYYEDYILSKKIRNMGLMVAICNDVRVKHGYSVSVDKNYNSRGKNKLLCESKLYYHTTFGNLNPIQRKLLKLVLKGKSII